MSDLVDLNFGNFKKLKSRLKISFFKISKFCKLSFSKKYLNETFLIQEFKTSWKRTLNGRSYK